MQNADCPVTFPPAGYPSPRTAPFPTLVAWAHEHLLAMLVSMEIAPGARIGIDAVARKLGISQTPIREALSRLEAEKLVIKVPNVGYQASAEMTPAEVSDHYVLRQLIEPYAAARAAEAITEGTLGQLAAMEAEMARIAVQDGVTDADFARADAGFHNLIATCCGNPPIAETVARLHMHLHIFRFRFDPGSARESAREHIGIIHALRARDPVAAEQAMRRHLEQSRGRMEASAHRANAPSQGDAAQAVPPRAAP